MNPFDDPAGRFPAVVNAEERYARWPDHLDLIEERRTVPRLQGPRTPS